MAELLSEIDRFLIENVRPTGRKLGTGSYGSVEEVEMNGVTCAAKKLHQVLIEVSNDPDGIQIATQKYVAECHLMSDLRHPHIVQFLGLCHLEGSSLPALVMEKMIASLDDVLENTPNIPLALKKSMLVDVTKGLVYLHTHKPTPIIHRDLTARNVLLNAAMVAKISDLGNSRMVTFQPGQLARTLSRFPGTLVYMPPEALEETASTHYGPSLDIFSFGHVALFTLTQVFPGELLRPTYPDPNNRRRLVARSEVERRKPFFTHLYQQLGERHPFVQVVERCLDDDPEYRPSAVDVLHQFEAVEIQDPYLHLTRLEMLQQLQEQKKNDEHIQRLQTQLQQLLVEKDRVTQEKDTEIHQLQVKMGRVIQEKDEVIRGKNAEIHQLQVERERVVREKDAEIYQLQVSVSEKDRAIQEKESVIQEQRLRDSEKIIQKPQEKVQPQPAAVLHPSTITPQEIGRSLPKETTPLQTNTIVNFTVLTKLPESLSHAQAVVYKGALYVGGTTRALPPTKLLNSHFQFLCVYQFQSRNWETIETPTRHYALAVYQGQVVLAGGCIHGFIPTSQLWLTDERHNFMESLPPMKIATESATALATETHLIVAGGYSGISHLDSVQVYDGQQWTLTQPLPVRSSNIKYTFHNNTFFLIGGGNQGKKVFCTTPSLLQQANAPAVWKRLPDVPLASSGIAVLQSSLVTIGGSKYYSNALHMYSHETQKWEEMDSTFPQALANACAITLPTGEVLVIGGETKRDGYSSQVHKSSIVE